MRLHVDFKFAMISSIGETRIYRRLILLQWEKVNSIGETDEGIDNFSGIVGCNAQKDRFDWRDKSGDAVYRNFEDLLDW